MGAHVALAVCAWLFAGCAICGYWAILRRGEKQRAAELAERAHEHEEEAARIQTTLQTEVLTPDQRDHLRVLYERALKNRSYWAARAQAWAEGDV